MAPGIRLVTSPYAPPSTVMYEPATFIDNNNIWHEIVLQTVTTNANYDLLPTVPYPSAESDAFFFWNATNEPADLDVDSRGNGTGTGSVNGTISWFDGTLDPATLELVRMTGTAMALGVLILATIVGKSEQNIIF